MDYFIGALQKYAEFTGRARRKEYWMFFLIYTVLIILVSVLDAILGLGFLSLIFSLAMLVPSISIAARRLHDTGRTGWWQLISFIPLIGIIILIVFLVQDSHEDNEYGPNPKSGETA
ncbi:DUF805 domain-containing protein [Paraglaciecola arctica]|uniref:DUF805 domain-containing protein n=1 Tax=Paraglaciecola arctica TaxID=1128911 RepID=UPI001C06F88F|nr:DUF805 domain-containing protein [Paraglaciecola arctica]MBU3006012.1 DUF805 domain-containing protein [Paraglaciecola arctica]